MSGAGSYAIERLIDEAHRHLTNGNPIPLDHVALMVDHGIDVQKVEDDFIDEHLPFTFGR